MIVSAYAGNLQAMAISTLLLRELWLGVADLPIRTRPSILKSMRYLFSLAVLVVGLTTVTPAMSEDITTLRAPVREANVPHTRWTHQPRHLLWNRAALSALKSHCKPLVVVPGDIQTWCRTIPTPMTQIAGPFGWGLCQHWPSTKAHTDLKRLGAVANGTGCFKSCLRRPVDISVT
jgi:hypothetical protein